MLMISAGSNQRLALGMPCTSSSLIEAQMLAGKSFFPLCG